PPADRVNTALEHFHVPLRRGYPPVDRVSVHPYPALTAQDVPAMLAPLLLLPVVAARAPRRADTDPRQGGHQRHDHSYHYPRGLGHGDAVLVVGGESERESPQRHVVVGVH